MADKSLSKKLAASLGKKHRDSHACDKITVSRTAGVNYKQELSVSFQRTVRVADNGEENALPPSLGTFPIYATSTYQQELPVYMADKPGYFIPMYQREAMWLNFKSTAPFAVKVYVGGVNAVSGEPARETETTMMRRLKLVDEGKNIQDYIITPKQLWLDGIASADGTVRQFVAMPLGKGYSVEAQITGEEVVGGLQIEVTPSKINPNHVVFSYDSYDTTKKPPGTPYFDLEVKTLTGRSIPLKVTTLHTVDEIKDIICNSEGIPPDQQRFIYRDKQLQDGRTLEDCSVGPGAKIHLVLALRGGGDPPPDMGIAAGGLIRQTIVKDTHNPAIWEPDCGTILNVQILNSAHFHEITGEQPPKTTVTAKAYAKHGYPYFSIFDEKPSGVKGNFDGVKSVNEMDIEGTPSMEKAKAVAEVIKSTSNPVVLLDEKGNKVGFRTMSAMEKAIRDFRAMRI